MNFVPLSNATGSARYYTRGKDEVVDCPYLARYHGNAAELLGIRGKTVTYDDLKSLLHNYDPVTGKQLTSVMNAKRIPGYEIGFSVPKSVSIMSAFGDDRIVGAFGRAVTATMNLMERDAAVRVRKAGADHNRTSFNLLWADVTHRLSRPVDGVAYPQIHKHLVLPNISMDTVEGQWKALQLRPIRDRAPLFEAIYFQRLATEIHKLGYDINRNDTSFEIAGVPHNAIDEMSQRKKQIDAIADTYNITTHETRNRITASHRDKKKSSKNWNELREAWRSRITADDQKRIETIRRTALTNFQLPPSIQNDYHFSVAFKTLSATHSVIPLDKLMAHASKTGLHQVTEKGLRQQAQQPLWIQRTIGGTQYITDRDMLRREIQLVELVKQSRGGHEKLGNDRHAVASFQASQNKALQKTLASRDKYTSMSGVVGAIKNRTLAAIRDASSRPVISSTVGKLEQLDVADVRGKTLVINQAHTLGFAQMEALAHKLDGVDTRVVFLSPNKKKDRGNALGTLEEGGMRTANIVNYLKPKPKTYRPPLLARAMQFLRYQLTKERIHHYGQELSRSYQR